MTPLHQYIQCTLIWFCPVEMQEAFSLYHQSYVTLLTFSRRIRPEKRPTKWILQAGRFLFVTSVNLQLNKVTWMYVLAHSSMRCNSYFRIRRLATRPPFSWIALAGPFWFVTFTYFVLISKIHIYSTDFPLLFPPDRRTKLWFNWIIEWCDCLYHGSLSSFRVLIRKSPPCVGCDPPAWRRWSVTTTTIPSTSCWIWLNRLVLSITRFLLQSRTVIPVHGAFTNKHLIFREAVILKASGWIWSLWRSLTVTSTCCGWSAPIKLVSSLNCFPLISPIRIV